MERFSRLYRFDLIHAHLLSQKAPLPGDQTPHTGEAPAHGGRGWGGGLGKDEHSVCEVPKHVRGCADTQAATKRGSNFVKRH